MSGRGKNIKDLKDSKEGVLDREVLDTLARQERSTGFEMATLNGERAMEQLQESQQTEREGLIAQSYELAGRVKALLFTEKVATVATLMQLKQAKETKCYRDLPGIGTWDKYCEYMGVSRRKVDEDLMNLSAFGSDFLATVSSFSLGYRELKKLRHLTADGSVVIEAECIVIGEERIPINEDHAEDLQVAIERVLEDRTKLNQRVERLEKDLKGVVEEETKGLKAEVKALVKEVKRLKPFDPEEKDRSFALDQVKQIKDAVAVLSGLCLRFMADERVMDDPVLMGEVEGQFNAAELLLKDTRRRWDDVVSVFDEPI